MHVTETKIQKFTTIRWISWQEKIQKTSWNDESDLASVILT